MFSFLLGCPFDLILLLDASGSICDDKAVDTCDNWRTVKRFLVDLINRIDIGDSGALVSLILFNSQAEWLWDFDE